MAAEIGMYKFAMLFHTTRRNQAAGLAWGLLSLGISLLWAARAFCAGNQYEAALEAMQPAPVALPSLGNPVRRWDASMLSNKPDKQRLRPFALEAVPPAAAVSKPEEAQETHAKSSEAAAAAQTETSTEPSRPEGAEGAAQSSPEMAENPEQVHIKAERIRYREGALEAEGNVEWRYRDIVLRGDKGHIDKERKRGFFEGTVRLQAPHYSALAENVRVLLETEEFSAHDIAAKIEPEFFEGEVLAPLYVRAQEMYGQSQQIRAQRAIGTSCDKWPSPHWMLQSEKVALYSQDRVIFRRPTVYLFGLRLFQYPWDLHLSLRRRENRFFPEIGQNDVEGFYAKLAYGYMLTAEHSGFMRLHLTQKRGLGWGILHFWEASNQFAEISVFSEPEQDSWTGRLLYRGRYGKPWSSQLSLNFQRNSGYSISTDSLSGNFSLRYAALDWQSELGAQYSYFSSGYSTSRRISSSFNVRQRLGRRGEWEIRNTYSSAAFLADKPADEEFEAQLTWRQEFRPFTLNITANQRYDVDGGRYTGDNNYFVLKRLPDIVLRTDSVRLGAGKIADYPLEATFYLGYFSQEPEKIASERAGLELRLPGWLKRFGANGSLRAAARFQQMFYAGAARWLGEAQFEYRQEWPDHWQTRLSFNYAHPEGFVPLRLDYASPVAVAYLEAVRLVPDRMRLHLSFGRDIQNGYYYDALLRSEIMLGLRNRLELQTGYSVRQGQFRPFNLRWIFATEHSWWSALTVNYDIHRQELTNVSLDMDWTPSRKWRLQFLGGFSQYGGIDQADIRITRDLHCMIAQFSYSYTTGEIRFGLGIKAFPSETRAFGIGARGQYFESYFPDVY